MHFKELDVYKKSYSLALEVHAITLTFLRALQFDLGDQIRRSSRSIPSNIAEGCGRFKSSKDTVNFLRTALGSNYEVMFNLEFCVDVKLIDVEIGRRLLSEYEVVGKQLTTLIKRISP